MLVPIIWKLWDSSKRRRLIKAGATSLLISTLYAATVTYGVPYFDKLDDTKYGVIFAGLSGSKLRDNLDGSSLEAILASRVEDRLFSQSLDTLVQIKSMAWVVNSREEALELSRRYSAKTVIWGDVVKLEHSAIVTLRREPRHIHFACALPDGTEQHIGFKVRTPREFELNLYDGSFNASEISSTLLNSMALEIVAFVSEFDLALSESLYISILATQPIIDTNEITPFAIEQGAFAAARRGDTALAMSLYDDSFALLLKLRDFVLNNPLYPDLTSAAVARFAAIARYQQGYHCLQRGDTTQAIRYFGESVAVDSIMPRYLGGLSRRVTHTQEQD